MATDSDPNQNQNLLAMNGLQDSTCTRTMADMEVNTRLNRNRSNCNWAYIKGEIVKWHTVLHCFIITFLSIIIVLLEYGYIPVSTVGFFCGDPSISHKYKGEIITPEILGVSVALLPLLILLLSELINKKRVKDIDFLLIAFYVRELLVGGILTLVVTEIAKSIIAEHRPHFFDVCEPDTAKGCIIGTWIEEFTCTSTKYSSYFIMDSTRSFPSGHSSVSAFFGVYCVYLVHVRFSTSQIGEAMKPLLVSICLTFTVVCSLTRISDRRHHWWDVLTGDFIGFSMALYYIFISHKKFQKIFGPLESISTNSEQNQFVV